MSSEPPCSAWQSPVSDRVEIQCCSVFCRGMEWTLLFSVQGYEETHPILFCSVTLYTVTSAVPTQVCSTWIGSRVVTDLNDLCQVHNLLVSSLDKVQAGKGSSSQVYRESATTMEKLAVLKTWAEVNMASHSSPFLHLSPLEDPVCGKPFQPLSVSLWQTFISFCMVTSTCNHNAGGGAWSRRLPCQAHSCTSQQVLRQSEVQTKTCLKNRTQILCIVEELLLLSKARKGIFWNCIFGLLWGIMWCWEPNSGPLASEHLCSPSAVPLCSCGSGG